MYAGNQGCLLHGTHCLLADSALSHMWGPKGAFWVALAAMPSAFFIMCIFCCRFKQTSFVDRYALNDPLLTVSPSVGYAVILAFVMSGSLVIYVSVRPHPLDTYLSLCR